MRLIRRLHAYLGLFIAPSVLFFAFSGGCQLFNLHEAHGSYQPPKLIQALGSLHKDQVLSKPEHDHGPPLGAGAVHDHAGPPDHDGDHDQAPSLSTAALKWFFEAVAAGLGLSTLMGVWLGLRFTSTPRLALALLVAGVLVPILIVLI